MYVVLEQHQHSEPLFCCHIKSDTKFLTISLNYYSFQAALIKRYTESPQCESGANVLPHFLGATAGSTSAAAIMRRLCTEMSRHFSLAAFVPQDYK